MIDTKAFRRADRKAQRSTVKCRRCEVGAFKGVASALVKRIEGKDIFYVHAETKICTSVLNIREAVMTETARRMRSPKLIARAIARQLWAKLGTFAWA